MNLFFDLKFTGLHQDTTIISLGIVAEDGQRFYAEFTDYDQDQVDAWIKEHVIDQLWQVTGQHPSVNTQYVVGTWKQIGEDLRSWLEQWPAVRFCGDVPAWDWVLLTGLLGGVQGMPDSVFYIALDLATALMVFGEDPDVDRRRFVGAPLPEIGKHNALDDAEIIRRCWHKLLDPPF